MATLNESKEEFLELLRDDLQNDLPKDEETVNNIKELIQTFYQSNLDEYVVRSFVDVICDALDDNALTPKNLHRYLNALRAASKG